MEKTTLRTVNDESVSDASLNARRRRAVELRIKGAPLADITAATSLSNPTIINAHKAFLEGGWTAVDRKPRGRSAGAVALGDDEPAILNELLGLDAGAVVPGQALWNYRLLQQWLSSRTGKKTTLRTTARYAERWQLRGSSCLPSSKTTQISQEIDDALLSARKSGKAVYSIGQRRLSDHSLLFAHDARGSFSWMITPGIANASAIKTFLERLHAAAGKAVFVLVSGIELSRQNDLQLWFQQNHSDYLQVSVAGKNAPLQAPVSGSQKSPADAATVVTKQAAPKIQHQPNPVDQTAAVQSVQSDSGQLASSSPQSKPAYPLAKNTLNKSSTTAESSSKSTFNTQRNQDATMKLQQKTDAEPGPQGSAATSTDSAAAATTQLTHLQRLEAESIHIFREVMAEAEKPVMLYSLGKDSAVLLHLARKAFFPAPLPMPLLHVDTTWKFKAMYEYRDQMVADGDCELIVHTNQEGLDQGVNPITHGSSLHTDIMKTQALRQAIDKHGFDVAVAGARRDEEGTRAKERVFSFRSKQHRWDPRNQRPELWNVFNTRKQPGESIRVFPLSNWTELDIWQYILSENISVVPLYYAAERPVVERDGNLILVDDERLTLKDGEVPSMRQVRFRTLGCYPLTGAVESSATTLPEIIAETFSANTSERSGRMIDHDASASMEQKKQEGYF